MLSAERKAVLLLLGLAVVGQGVRYLATRPSEAPGQVQLLSVLPPGSPNAHRDSTIHEARPLRPNERLDPNTANAAELARLPRVGLALAKTIVADRNAHGPFGGVDGLDRVPGIGPGLLRTIAPHLEFSGANRFSLDAKASGAGVGTPFASHHPRPVAVVPEGTGAAALNVNRATALELEGLPGIGPALARRIVADRESRGPFATVAAMDRVSGIGPALVLRLGKLVTAP